MEPSEATNPYAPPATIADGGKVAMEGQHAIRDLARGWEKLRLWYNLVMLPPGLIILGLFVFRNNMPVPAAIFLGLMSGLGANAAFFLGPLAELYIRGWCMGGRPATFLRKFLFIAGMGISLLITLVFLGIAAFA